MRYLIDGCNFLIQQFDSYTQKDRELFIDVLKLFQNKRSCQLYLFFDSRDAIVPQVEHVQKGFQVRYVPSPADTHIVRFITDEKNRRNIIIVTDDRAHISTRARQLGAQALSTKEFHDLIFPKKNIMTEEIPEKPQTDSEIAKKRYLHIWEEPEGPETETDRDRYLRLWGDKSEEVER